MVLRILGAADWRPDLNNDHACYLLDGHILIDCCSGVLMNLINGGADPAGIDLILFTHMHPDHFLGLPSLLHYQRTRNRTLREITILGPKEMLERAAELSMEVAFFGDGGSDEEPVLVPLAGGDPFTFDRYRIRTLPARHSVPGLCYRVTEVGSEKSVGFTGDTMAHPEMSAFFRGVDLLVHEATFGAEELPGFNSVCRHSNARMAVRTAEEAGAGRLLLTHAGASKWEAAVELARSLTDIPADWAWPGREITL